MGTRTQWWRLMRAARGVLALAILALMMAGCANLFATDTDYPYPPPNDGGVLPAPNPVSVTPVLDNARAKTVTFGSDGGTASVTGGDGTVFTLTVPQGALLQDADITLTPLTDIPDLPTAGGFVAGVDLQPDGLRFATPAELVMELGSGLDASDLTPALISGANHEFGLVPAEVDGRSVTFSLAHFTDPTAGAGRAKGNPVPSSVEGRAMTAISEDLAQGIKLNTVYAQILEQWYDSGVKARIDGATSDQALVGAIQEFHDWLYEIMVLGAKKHVSGLPAILHGRVADGASRYRARVGGIVKAGVTACRTQHKPAEGWDVTLWPPLVDIGSQLSETDFRDIIPPATPDVQQWAGAISGCLRFDVNFADTIDGTAHPAAETFSATAVGLAHLALAYSGVGWSWSFKPTDDFDDIGDISLKTHYCEVTSWKNLESQFHIVSIDALRPNPRTPTGLGVDLDPAMSLTFDPGQPDALVTQQCTNGGSGTATLDLWRIGFDTVHDILDLDTKVRLDDWVVPWGPLVARAKLNGTNTLGDEQAGWTFTEHGEVTLSHMPQ